MELIGPVLGFMFIAFLFAVVLAAWLGHPSRLLVGGLVVALTIPFVLAIWDPDGPCDDWCFLNFSPGEWFVLGAIGSFLLYAGWAIGVRVGSSSRTGPDGAR